MPYTISRNANGTCKLVNKVTGKVHAKASTKANVEKQLRLLEMMDNRKKR